MKTEFKSFWFGNPLSPFELLCIQSFLDHGHAFTLYAYDELSVPTGVELKDAREILPREDVFHYSSGPGAGSVAAFANLFRYALLTKYGGWWVDMDTVCLTDVMPNEDLFFAFESDHSINNAVMRFPAGHEVMKLCLDKATLLGRDVTWGSAGPKLVTEEIEKAGLTHLAHEPQSCYPVAWRDYLQVFYPAMRKSVELRTEKSIATSLWNEMIRRLGLNKKKAPPRNSYLDSLCELHGIKFSEGRTFEPEIRLRAALKRRLDGEVPWSKLLPTSIKSP